MSKKNLFIGAFVSLLVGFMGYHVQRADGVVASAKPAQQMDTATEIENWKTELITHKWLGTPCRFTALDTPGADRWRQENPDQLNGLPSDDKEIGTAQRDFDGDGKPDLLMYLNSQNCSGRNGDTPWFAKIIYATGSANAHVVSDIHAAMFDAYEKMRASNTHLKPVSRDYADEAISVGYAEQISGHFRLYTTDDAHCCPTYQGTYTYEPYKREIQLNFKK